jgi:hypothetical protein
VTLESCAWVGIVMLAPWVFTGGTRLALMVRRVRQEWREVKAGPAAPARSPQAPAFAPSEPHFIDVSGRRLPTPEEQMVRDVLDVIRYASEGKRNASGRQWIGARLPNSGKACTPSRWGDIAAFLTQHGMAVDYGERVGLVLQVDYEGACQMLGQPAA